MKASAPVFETRDGDRFIFPGLIHRPDDEDGISRYEVTTRAQSVSLALGSQTRLLKDWHAFDDEAFPHIKADITHSAFRFHAETVYMFQGPAFEAALRDKV